MLTKWAKGAWTFTAGARYEDVSLLKRDFTAADPRRSGKVRIETPNHAAAWLPGFGFNVKLTSQLSLLGGVHRGFARRVPRSTKKLRTAPTLKAVRAGVRAG